jgi:hypothetical protein
MLRAPEVGEVAQVIVFAHDSTAVTMPVRPWHPDGTAYYFVQNAQRPAQEDDTAAAAERSADDTSPPARVSWPG